MKNDVEMKKKKNGFLVFSMISIACAFVAGIFVCEIFDKAIANELNSNRVFAMLIVGAIIFLLLIFIFVFYFKVSRKDFKKLQMAKQKAVKENELKSEFISGMSHGIRTAMNGIMGMSAIARANINDAKRVTDCLSKITLSSKRLLELISDVLDMNKIESGDLSFKTQVVSLREVMDKLVDAAYPQIKSRNQEFDVFVQNIQTEHVYGDAIRLNQIFTNLLSNAIKFTQDCGLIQVYLQQKDSPRGQNFVRCVFTVHDNGVGMTEDFQQQIFEKFSREQTMQLHETEGSGLGMALTKSIIDAMGGTIELKSLLGAGTEFIVTLDFERAEIKEPNAVFPSWKALVVDDDEDLCRNSAKFLKDAGMKAEWTTNGQNAIEMAQKRHNSGDDYQLVLIDSQMPETDSIEIVKSFRDNLGDKAPILIMAAYDWSDFEDEARKAGARGFISKPLFKSNLLSGLSPYVLGAETPNDEPKKSEKTDAAENKETNRFAGKRILLAEDNELNWEIASELLSDKGFIVERAENGLKCVEAFSKSEVGKYDVILMDVRMPVMNGYDATTNIRAIDREDANIPIIAMTADAFSDDLQRCKECGMNEHLSKPVDADLLVKILARYLK